MKKIFATLLTLILFCIAVDAHGAMSAAKILQKSADALLSSGGITTSYTYKAGSYVEKGTLNVKGKMFSIISSSHSIWYNGKSLWTLDTSENEVSLTAPTAAEAATMNPYLLVSNYKTEYTATLVKSNVKGTYAIQLIPKSRQHFIKTATLCVRSSNYMPVRLDIADKTGAKYSIYISNIKTGVKLSESNFIFPTSKYPGVKLIDLR